MRLSLWQYGSCVTIEVRDDDLSVGEVVEALFRPAMLAAGYSDQSIDRSIGSKDEDALDALARRDECH